MSVAIKTKIGFVSGGTGSMPHYNSFLPMVPAEVELDFQGLQLYGNSLYEIGSKKDIIVQRVKDFVATRRWDGVIVTAAPTEVLNPGSRRPAALAVLYDCPPCLRGCAVGLRSTAVLLTPSTRA
jgi:hypothetical protein